MNVFIFIAIVLGFICGFFFKIWRENVSQGEIERQANALLLPSIYDQLAKAEDGKKEVDGGQIRDLFGEIGKRWRKLSWSQVLAEVWAIRERAGRS